MSENPTGRSRKPVLAIVLVVTALAVGAFNLKTFGPRRGKASRAEIRVQSHAVMPGDLEDVLRGTSRLGLAQAASAATPLPALRRDPFIGREAAATMVATASGTAVVPDGRGADAMKTPDVLSCSAVLLGGSQPTALISGEAVRIGDTVRGRRVTSIDIYGVQLDGPGPDRLFLPVGPATDAGRIRGRERGTTISGGTVEHESSERISK